VTVLAQSDVIEASQRVILDAVGDPPDLTLVRGAGNRGDELIWAGTRELLSERIYREIDLSTLPSARGHTVLLSGGGAFSRAYHELMPRALAVAGLRFERVIVLPSSFDPSEDEVREALAHTRATVFAREAESHRRILSLCDARLAHDCAFFFDFAPYRREGSGTLNAFRTDREAAGHHELPPGNDDISASAPSLDRWLEAIARHETIRTDRAHVMIAGALLGKRVEFARSTYHKLEAIADYALADYPVVELPRAAPRVGAGGANGRPSSHAAEARVTAVVLTRDRPQRALRAIDSVRGGAVPVGTLVVDNNSAPAAAAALAGGCEERDGVVLRRSDRNLGCAGGRRLALETVDTEFVLFNDDDAELEPGALDLLAADLEGHPDAAAVTATVVFPDGSVQHSGGSLKIAAGVADFGLIGAEVPDAATLPATGPADWVPGTAVLVRRAVLDEFPIDDRMSTYYEDNEWCYRVELARPGTFRRCREARAVHHFTRKHAPGRDFAGRSLAVELLEAQAQFYARHGVLLGTPLFELVPELLDSSGTPDVAGARLLMELLLAKGTDWVFTGWMNGELDPLLVGAGREREEAKHAERLQFLYERHVTLEQVESGGWWRLRRRVLPALRIYSRLRKSAGRRS
jgi:GT2 family glycosyltransferase/exopolysaccharide biosynthesis predicted pyruvyltransferase EpsI